MWVLPVAAVGLAVCGWETLGGQQPAAKVPAKLLQTKLDLARKTFQEYWKSQEFRSAEVAYQWSCRWLDAQRQLSTNKTEQKAAADAHLTRMQDVQAKFDQLYQGKLVGLEQVYATAYFVAEAEIWVAQAKD
jgi:hypothetical protein